MNSSYLTLLALGLGMTFVGCSGDNGDNATDNNPTDNTGDDDDTTPTGDTAPDAPTYLNVTEFHMYGTFGFDGGGLVTVSDGTNDIVNELELVFSTSAWLNDFTDHANYCYIVIPLEGATLAQWAQDDENLIYGVDADPAAVATTDCDDDTNHDILDPAVWGTGADLIAGWVGDGTTEPWGVAVGEYGEELIAFFEDYATETTDYYMGDPGWIGSTIRFPEVQGGDTFDGMYAQGYAIDGNNTIIFDENDEAFPITFDDAIGTGALAPALYLVDSPWYFNLTP